MKAELIDSIIENNIKDMTDGDRARVALIQTLFKLGLEKDYYTSYLDGGTQWTRTAILC